MWLSKTKNRGKGRLKFINNTRVFEAGVSVWKHWREGGIKNGQNWAVPRWTSSVRVETRLAIYCIYTALIGVTGKIQGTPVSFWRCRCRRVVMSWSIQMVLFWQLNHPQQCRIPQSILSSHSWLESSTNETDTATSFSLFFTLSMLMEPLMAVLVLQ